MRIRISTSTKLAIAFVHDLAMAGLAYVLALWLRLGDDLARQDRALVIGGALVFMLIAAGVFRWFGLYRGIWRFASFPDLARIVRATTLIVLVFLATMFVGTRLQDLPRSAVFIAWFVMVLLLAGPRIVYRLAKDGRFDLSPQADDPGRVPVLLIGAASEAERFIEASERPGAPYRVVGMIDETGTRRGRSIRGVEVMGSVDDLPAVLEQLASLERTPQRLVVTRAEFAGPPLERLLDEADRAGIAVARLPRITELRTTDQAKLDVRPIAIEDLLGRPQAVLDRAPVRSLVAGRRVLVTGAGGSIGSELARQIADLGPSLLLLLDSSEFALYSIDLEIGERHPALARRPVLADVRDRARLDRAFAEHRPELVFHAAALKHVPMVEGHPAEGVLTNTIGTRNVADAARAHRVAAMVAISTDKAVNPSSVMGATKRLAESYCQALDLAAEPGATRFVTVRFGNVLGSTGSVVPLFQRQLAAGGPLTVTHPDMKRYFMTVREAVELVLQASAFGARAETRTGGKILVLDMGEPVRIVDLARRMIRLAGLKPDKDVAIVFTGLRQGEKLEEELFHAAEPLAPTSLPGVQLASPRVADCALLARAFDEVEAQARAGREGDVLAGLRRLVPEFVWDAGTAPPATGPSRAKS
ncbi:MAG: polysaccharide biosynthesis protein [Alphaproteobacteria bacterium]|nr:polysaccharide biosynthesis protein [Alphaproteobacteria bacterium]